jgi:hypothetical protein
MRSYAYLEKKKVQENCFYQLTQGAGRRGGLGIGAGLELMGVSAGD